MINSSMFAASGVRGTMDPVIRRLSAETACSPGLVARINALGARVELAQPRAILQSQDEPVRRPRYLISGWGCRYRDLADGRKQIFDFVLPGEGVGVCLRSHPLALTTTAALTTMRLVDASPLFQADGPDEEMRAALQAQADAGERRALDQIMRLGRLTALERMAHLLLELHARLAIIGHAEGDRFPMPLTQETLADVTGLSAVHVNRTLQELRRSRLMQIERGWVRLLDREGVATLANFEPELQPPVAPR